MPNSCALIDGRQNIDLPCTKAVDVLVLCELAGEQIKGMQKLKKGKYIDQIHLDRSEPFYRLFYADHYYTTNTYDDMLKSGT